MMDEEFASLAEHLLSRELYDKWTPTYGKAYYITIHFAMETSFKPFYLLPLR